MSRKHVSRSLFPGRPASVKMKKDPSRSGAYDRLSSVGARYIVPLHPRLVAPLVNRPRTIRASALRFWFRLRNDGRCHCFLLERVLQDLVQRPHVSDLDVAENEEHT